MTHPHSSSNGIFTEIFDRCQKVVVDLSEVTALCEVATADEQLGIATYIIRIQEEVGEVLRLIQAVVFKVTPERRDILLANLKEILAASETNKQAHIAYLIRIYGQEDAELIVAMAEAVAQGTSK